MCAAANASRFPECSPWSSRNSNQHSAVSIQPNPESSNASAECRVLSADCYLYSLFAQVTRMKILVCMKQVPQKDAPLKLNESGTWIREDVSYEVNEPDAFALEEALRQKEKHSGEVVVITAGPARAQQVLREALAKGRTAPSILKTTPLSDSMRSTPPAPSRPPSKKKSSISFSPACSPTITATRKPAWYWPNCWAGRTPPSSCRSKRPMAASR